MTSTSLARTPRHMPRLGSELAVTAGAAVLALGAANFIVGLGSSSLFVDDAFSWIVAAHPLRDLYSQVKLSEVAPPGYYAFLHLWLHIGGSMTETWMRIPSAIAGVLLVGVGGWLGALIAGRTAAVSAALLLAVSPLMLTYSQQVRAYIFVMLAATLAVALAVRAVSGDRHRLRWLAGSCAAAVAAIWLHYTCLPVIVALAIWVATRCDFPPRARALFVGVLCLAQALVTPLLVHQASTGNPGADAYSHLTVMNAFVVLGNPVDGPYASHLPALIITAAAITAAVTILALDARRDAKVWLLVAAALLPPLTLFAVTIVAKPVLISRYCTVATPFAIAAVAAAFARRPTAGAIPLLMVCATAAIGSITLHEPRSRWPAIGAAFHAAGTQWQRSDALVLSPGIDPVLTSAPLDIYYTKRYLPRGAIQITTPGRATVTGLLRERRRLWLVSTTTSEPSQVNSILRPFSYHVALIRRFTSDETLQLTLVAPSPAARAQPHR